MYITLTFLYLRKKYRLPSSTITNEGRKFWDVLLNISGEGGIITKTDVNHFFLDSAVAPYPDPAHADAGGSVVSTSLQSKQSAGLVS